MTTEDCVFPPVVARLWHTGHSRAAPETVPEMTTASSSHTSVQDPLLSPRNAVTRGVSSGSPFGAEAGVTRGACGVRRCVSVSDREFLVAYDYGMGGLWGVIVAPSEDAILAKYPELQVVPERPEWMDDETFDRLHADLLCLDDAPTGILRAVVADRHG